MEKRHIEEIKKMSYQERYDKIIAMMEKSNTWKSKYEYFQLAKDVNENSIIVSET